uniref:Uncharacterized protein n=1 Tax=Cuerna arida TaxID=1464854 RepID=A0A1B6GCM9_9HEMI
MAATVKHTTILVVVRAFIHLHAEAAQLGRNREIAESARYDQEKSGIHLDTLQGRNQAAETFLEVEAPLEKQSQYTNFNRKIENSKLWQKLKTQLHKVKLEFPKTDPLIKKDNDGPRQNYRVKTQTKLSEKQQEQQPPDQQLRPKREVVIHPQLKPEMVMQPRIEMPMEKDAEEKYQEKLSQNRGKRQILYLLDGRGVPLLFRPVRTTPNPFIRQTNIEDYEIVRPNLGEEFRPIAGDDADADSSDVESSYQLNKEDRNMSKVVSDYYMRQNFEKWLLIQQFGVGFFKSVLRTKIELDNKEAIIPISSTTPIMPTMNGVGWNRLPSVENDLEEMLQMRLKRSVTRKRRKRKPRHKEAGKTLQRKRAKKRKQKQRRVERKRLRMLTHARRLRKQKKSKQARLERHYARMNMTTSFPGQLMNHSRENSTLLRKYDVNDQETSDTGHESTEEKYSGETYEDENTDSSDEESDEYSDENSTLLRKYDVNEQETSDTGHESTEEKYSGETYEDENTDSSDEESDEYSDENSTDNGNDDYDDDDYDDSDDDDNSDYENIEYENVEDKPYKPDGEKGDKTGEKYHQQSAPVGTDKTFVVGKYLNSIRQTESSNKFSNIILSRKYSADMLENSKNKLNHKSVKCQTKTIKRLKEKSKNAKYKTKGKEYSNIKSVKDTDNIIFEQIITKFKTMENILREHCQLTQHDKKNAKNIRIFDTKQKRSNIKLNYK